MKKILFTINTLGRAGAETALIELLRRLENRDYEVYLYVIMGQGELISEVPSYVTMLNPSFDSHSVLSRDGRKRMVKTVAGSLFRNGRLFSKLGHAFKIYRSMKKHDQVQTDKLLWRILSDGAPRFDQKFDLAVAWLEGASAYYTADHVDADAKAAFIHIDYESAGYTREMDLDCFAQFDRIFAVSDETREHFIRVYPEYDHKVGVIHNLIDIDKIRREAQLGDGFTDDYDGIRLLTVGRLSRQKAYETAIDAMKILKDSGQNVRWYVLGEGSERRTLEKRIAALGLQDDFLLVGAVDNPYPYYRQTDIYVHATRFEGKSIAIEEAQVLGRPIVATDCRGNREQIESGIDGLLCDLSPTAVASGITELLQDESRRSEMGRRSAKKLHGSEEELQSLLELVK